MTRAVSRIFIAVSLAVIGWFFLSLISAIAQAAQFADRLYPGTAVWVFWSLALLFLGLLLMPIHWYFRLPQAPVPPSGDDPAAMESFQQALREHFKSNPRLADMELAANEEIPLALTRLGDEADAVVKRTASAVFVSTAVMQNGRLDGLMVLVSQLRLVWRIASIYRGRPSPRQMLHLYANVGANVLIADNIQEIDFAEIATPIVASLFPSIKGGIPGLQGISTLLVNSLSNGAANAFLTLRVGLVAKAYCAALSALQEN
ncbi:MAG: YcjF family protein, partial [Candidatus Accumulibacter sp.]|nr:YcjF family protein [Accumulibacter sp.]